MKIAALIARILLGLVFLVFGANGFLNFIPSGPMPSGLAGQFITVLFQSHYVLVVSPHDLGFFVSLNFIIFLLFGGLQTLWGPMLGAVLLTQIRVREKGRRR